MRLDVIVRNMDEIDKISDSLTENRIKHIDITHAQKGIDPVDVAKRLVTKQRNLDITIHLSAKYFNDRSLEEARTGFRRAFEDAKRNRIRKFLIISGHPRGTFDTLEALQLLQNQQLTRDVEIFCAYNPYFDPARLREENERLRSKLAYSFVQGVYIQIGMDTEKLRKGVEYIRSVRHDVQLLGSVPVPSEATLNRLKLVALYGVFLPNSYLLSVDSAKEMTNVLLRAFQIYGIEPVVFAPHIQDLKEALSLFT